MIFQIIRRLLNKSYRPKRRLALGILIIHLMICIFGLLYYLAESPRNTDLGFWDSIWWAMVTVTTVGYGDYYAESFIGRFFVSWPFFIVGIGLVGYLLGVSAEMAVDRMNRRNKGLGSMKGSGHLVICHCPSLDKVIHVVEEYRATEDCNNLEAVVISDNFEEWPHELRENDIRWLNGTPTTEEVLQRANIPEAKGIVVLSKDPQTNDSDASSYAVASLAKHLINECVTPPRIIVEVTHNKNLDLIKRSGADALVPIRGYSESLLVHELVSPGIREVFDQLATYHSGLEIYILDQKLADSKFSSIQIKAIQHPIHLQVLGLIRNGIVNLAPEKKTVISSDDKLVVLAKEKRDYLDFESNHLTNR